MMGSILKVRDENGNFVDIPAIRGGEGKSAYEHALEGGFVGTEEEFNKAISELSPSVTPEMIGAADAEHNHSAADITSGVLGVARGGTGAITAAGALANLGLTATTTELNYVDGVTSNIQTQLNAKAASSHSHSASNITSGTLPIVYGGTGASDRVNANKSIMYIGYVGRDGIIPTLADDTVTNWKDLGAGYVYVAGAGKVTDQPANYGWIENKCYIGEIVQYFHSSAGATFRRNGSISRPDKWDTSWVKMLDESAMKIEKGTYKGGGGLKELPFDKAPRIIFVTCKEIYNMVNVVIPISQTSLQFATDVNYAGSCVTTTTSTGVTITLGTAQMYNVSENTYYWTAIFD